MKKFLKIALLTAIFASVAFSMMRPACAANLRLDGAIVKGGKETPKPQKPVGPPKSVDE